MAKVISKNTIVVVILNMKKDKDLSSILYVGLMSIQ